MWWESACYDTLTMKKPASGSVIHLQCLNLHGKCYHNLMHDVLYSYMSVVCTYHCRSVLGEQTNKWSEDREIRATVTLPYERKNDHRILKKGSLNCAH